MRTLRAVRPLPAGQVDTSSESGPLVSVICPARNEADAIEAATQTRLADPEPWMEFIFVDDRSDDATADILERECGHDPRARVIRNVTLPEGWLGKVHAQQIGLEHAQVQEQGWYLFSDGDTHVLPGAVASAIAWAECEQADHVAMTPRMVGGPLVLRLCLAPLMRVLICTLRLWLANDDDQPRAMGVGAFNLVRRSALERAGGLEQLRLEIADDVGLAQIIKDAGARSRSAIGAQWVEIEWYRTTGQFLRGAEKGVAKARTRIGIAVSGLLGILLIAIDVSPLVMLMWWPSPWALLAAATVAMATALSVMLAMSFGLPRWWSLLWPLGAVAGLLITLRSMALALIRGGVQWRGDTHTLASTSEGERVRLS
ncbi:MAG: glycosyltransferase family 2 protein [Phycisphaerales bacterium]|nr:glycosyltransferase family 2 protein [Phycisphaerales bacterium]